MNFRQNLTTLDNIFSCDLEPQSVTYDEAVQKMKDVGYTDTDIENAFNQYTYEAAEVCEFLTSDTIVRLIGTNYQAAEKIAGEFRCFSEPISKDVLNACQTVLSQHGDSVAECVETYSDGSDDYAGVLSIIMDLDLDPKLYGFDKHKRYDWALTMFWDLPEYSHRIRRNERNLEEYYIRRGKYFQAAEQVVQWLVKYGVVYDHDFDDSDLMKEITENQQLCNSNISKFKEELISKTWAPDRFREWCLTVDGEVDGVEVFES